MKNLKKSWKFQGKQRVQKGKEVIVMEQTHYFITERNGELIINDKRQVRSCQREYSDDVNFKDERDGEVNNLQKKGE